jgi:Rod binding domain-containing protein
MDIQPLTTTAPELPPNQPAQSQNNPGGATFSHLFAQASSENDKIAGVAKQFEALIAGQVLKAAREASDGGWLADDDDQTGELTLEMAEQGFAQALGAQGGLGIAKMVTASLKPKTSR